MNKKSLIWGSSFVLVLALTFLSFFTKERRSGEYIMMRVYEPIDAKSELIVSYGNGTTDRIDLKDLHTANHEHNVDLITNTINRLSGEGYTLVSTAGSGAANRTSLVHVETYIFVKE